MKWLKNWWYNLRSDLHDALRPKSSIQLKQALYAVVIKACTKCGSAGVDSQGQDVGDICPVCNADRPKNDNRGLIWRKMRNAN